MTSLRPAAGERLARRRAIERSVARTVVAVVVVAIVYAAAPIEPRSDLGAVVRITLGVLVAAAVTVWQVIAVTRSPTPRLRAVEALAVTVATLICAFALVYLNLSARDPSAFSEPLGRIDALYFTVVTLATVGYGDIAARSETARITVIVQIAFNVAIIGTTVRLIVRVARGTADRP